MSNLNIGEMKGVIPAMITAFDEKGNIDEKGMRECVQHLMRKKN